MVWREHNCTVWRKYGILPFLHNLMADFRYSISHIQIISSNLSMLVWWVMFCEVIPHVWAYWFPINKEVFFKPCPSSNKSIYPLTWIFLSDCIGDDALSCGFFCSDWGWWLGKTNLVECHAEGYSFLPIMKQSPDFCFEHGFHHVF